MPFRFNPFTDRLDLTDTGGSPSGGFTWNVVTSGTNPNQVVRGNGYIAKGASQTVFILPPSATVGDVFAIIGYGNLWTLTQNAGQTVTLGDKTTTAGASGSITATQVRDCVEVVCVTANTEFQIYDVTGNLTFV